MKKNTKGAIAVAAAALLLAGGAGTMAAWSDTASLGGGTVTAGKLEVTQTSAGAWTWAGTTDAFNPTTDRLVPGDSVEYKAAYKLGVEGKNIVASLTPSLGGVTGELLPHLTVDAAATTTGIGLNNITPTDNGKTVGVATTITFKSDTSSKDGMGKTANLAGSTITLQQTAPAAPPTSTTVVGDNN